MSNALSIENVSSPNLFAVMAVNATGVYIEGEDEEPVTQRIVRHSVAPTLVVEAQTCPAPAPIMTVPPKGKATLKGNVPSKPIFMPGQVRRLIAKSNTFERQARWILGILCNEKDRYSPKEFDAVVDATRNELVRGYISCGNEHVLANADADELIHEFVQPHSVETPPPSSRQCIPPPSSRTAVAEAKKTTEQPKLATAEEIQKFITQTSKQQKNKKKRSK